MIEIITYVALLIVGLILLIIASNLFVDASSSLATRLKVPKMIIALTIAAFGTCAPELAISFTSMASGNTDITLANVIGSCIINILLIISIAALIKPIKFKEKTIKIELPLILIVTSLITFLLNDALFFNKEVNTLSRLDSIFLVMLFVVFMFYIFKSIKDAKKEKNDKAKYSLVKSIIYLSLALIVVIASSNLVVDNSVLLAEKLGVSEKIISMTILVIGSSLPELSLTVACAIKGEHEMVLGNIIGTNIFNICVVLALPVLIYGNINTTSFDLVDSIMLVISSFMLYIFGKTNKELSKTEGIIMLIVLLIYYVYLFLV